MPSNPGRHIPGLKQAVTAGFSRSLVRFRARLRLALRCRTGVLNSFISDSIMQNTFIFIIEMLGTVAFAISGIRLAAAKNFDWFGAYVVGLVTAIGGGTVRDLLLGLPVFWMMNWSYLAVTALSLVAVIMFRRALVGGMRTLFIFDAIGLALFVVVGIEKTLSAEFPMWTAIVMGIITGSFGGVTRDILINDEPLFFRKEIYATACLAGGVFYWLTDLAGAIPIVSQLSCAVGVVGLRIAAVRYGWSLPILKVDPAILPEDHDRRAQSSDE